MAFYCNLETWKIKISSVLPNHGGHCWEKGGRRGGGGGRRVVKGLGGM